MQNYATLTAKQTDVVRGFMARTYTWMTAGLALTAGVAWMTAQNMELMMTVYQWRLPLFLLQLGIVWFMNTIIARLGSAVAGVMFLVYAAVTGLTFSGLLAAYDLKSVTAAFATSALTFGAMSVAGYTIKKDLSGMSKFFTFALIGLCIAMLVNMFVGGTVLTMLISVVGVVLFAGLTVYDTQKLRQMALGGLEGEQAEGAAINGALSLYLDFINIFLFLLRIFGGGRR